MTSTAVLERGGPAAGAVIEFGPFRYEPLRRRICDAQGPCRIGSRALELLGVLLESPGRFYSRDELEARVWPRTVVEQTSLRVHVSALRRVLGDDVDSARYIVNMPGRGYAFVAPVRSLGAPEAEVAAPAPPHQQLEQVEQLAQVTHLRGPVGREGGIARLGELLAQERLVSVVGPGGVGKTTVALCAAQAQVRNQGGPCVADFAGVAEAALVAAEIGRACGVAVPRDYPGPALERALQGSAQLIVLDNCEHLIEPVAALVARLMRSCPRLRFIATSREPLNVDGEWVFMLPPLGLPALPAPGRAASTHELLGSPAVQLFVERARSACDSFQFTEHNAAAVAQLCALLDGMPLAIELAAAMAARTGVQALAARGDDLLDLLAGGRRTAPPRHRSLRALLEGSYRLLSEPERLVLQRLAVFDGAFGLDQALGLPHASGPGLQPALHDVLGLCAKSMLVCESLQDGVPRYRLLHAVRLFARQQARLAPVPAPVPETELGRLRGWGASHAQAT